MKPGNHSRSRTEKMAKSQSRSPNRIDFASALQPWIPQVE